eukprot:14587537-Ditylum_brightwellii.AAC.1
MWHQHKLDHLLQHPEGNSVKGQVNVVVKEELGKDVGNFLNAARNLSVSPIQANLGQEKGGIQSKFKCLSIKHKFSARLALTRKQLE